MFRFRVFFSSEITGVQSISPEVGCLSARLCVKEACDLTAELRCRYVQISEERQLVSETYLGLRILPLCETRWSTSRERILMFAQTMGECNLSVERFM